jgi:hypothetical protein
LRRETSGWAAVVSVIVDHPESVIPAQLEVVLHDVMPGVQARAYDSGWDDDIIDIIVDAPTYQAASALAERVITTLGHTDISVREDCTLVLRRAGET